MSPRPLAALVLAVAVWIPAVAIPPAAAMDELWREDLKTWRERADAGLRRDRGWLSIVGRWELEPGASRIGSAPGSEIRLPEGPLRVVGEHAIEIHLHADVNVEVTVVLEGQEVEAPAGVEMDEDEDEDEDSEDSGS